MQICAIEILSITRLDELKTSDFPDLQQRLENLKLFSDYYAAYARESFNDHSFIVHDNKNIQALVLVYEFEKRLMSPSDGVNIDVHSSIPKQVGMVYGMIIKYLEI